MVHELTARARVSVLLFRLLFVMAVAGNAPAQDLTSGPAGGAQAPLTNLLDLLQAVNSNSRVVRDVKLEGAVCAATDPEIGVVILRDASGVGIIELGGDQPALAPGEIIRIEGLRCLLRRRDMGVKISALPTVDNDGVHGVLTNHGTITLPAGRYPLRLEWFNQFRDFSLGVTWQWSNAPAVAIPSSALWHRVASGASGSPAFEPGLRVDAYEGNWQSLPDFELLKPAKSGIAANFDLNFRTRDLLEGLQFRGFIDLPYSGEYTFTARSDDGSLLFIGTPAVKITKLGKIAVPLATREIIGEPVTNPTAQQWVSVEGRVEFVSPWGRGLELKLRSEGDMMRVRIADASGLDPAKLLNSRVRITGAGLGVFDLNRRVILGELFAAMAGAVEWLEPVSAGSGSTAPLTSVKDVQSLPLEDAKRNLPVHIQGVVTSLGAFYDRWLSIQDDTRGIFVDIRNVSNSIPTPGDFCEVVGQSAAGDFAPIVVAQTIHRLGRGDFPEPVHPAWNELISGSMDVQWAEIQGLVTGVRSNILSLRVIGGQLDVTVDLYDSRLAQFQKSVVRIQGVLFANWTSGREVSVGNVRMRNASITVDVPAPTDPFDAVTKTPQELLQFDTHATAFRRVKVPGQVVHAETNQIFLAEDGVGIRVLPTESKVLRAGDIIEAVGYPDITGTTVLLREALVRRVGHKDLPPAKKLKDQELTDAGLDSTRVHVEGTLLEWHFEQGLPVLEMRSGSCLYLARLPRGASLQFSLRPGSVLALNGIYVGHGRNYRPGLDAESFELLINYADDVAVLARVSWWTLQRMLVIVGMLIVVLTAAVIWITQLRRLVEQRTTQLQLETRERERVERQHALEAERSRIARDLHDDLGSSLTEINVLASTGQRPRADGASQANLFHAIAGKARSLIAALDIIVWAVDPEDNLLQSLADYLTGYMEEFFSSTNIACRFRVPVSLPPVTLDGRVRHDLLMAVKEALNNVVRHAEATEVEFCMEVVEGNLGIKIIDNGKGFEGGSGKGRHGLKNLSSRLLMLGGSCTVESRVAGGTTVTIHLPLPAASPKPALGSA